MVKTDSRWETWRCAKCGRERSQQAVPHQQPECCGTGMWWQELWVGRTYVWDDDPDGRD